MRFVCITSVTQYATLANEAGVSITHFASRTLFLKYSNFQQFYKKKLKKKAFWKRCIRSDMTGSLP